MVNREGFEPPSTWLRARSIASYANGPWCPYGESNPAFQVESLASLPIDDRDMVERRGIKPRSERCKPSSVFRTCPVALLTGIEPASPARQAGRFSRCVQQHGGYGWTRTSDLPLFRRALYQLSYDAMVPQVGVEPTRALAHWFLRPACLPSSITRAWCAV
jgi:hypothetical protein